MGVNKGGLSFGMMEYFEEKDGDDLPIFFCGNSL